MREALPPYYFTHSDSQLLNVADFRHAHQIWNFPQKKIRATDKRRTSFSDKLRHIPQPTAFQTESLNDFEQGWRTFPGNAVSL